MKRFALFLLLSIHGPLSQAQFASLRQARIFAGDIAELTITYESAVPSMYAIDTAPLETDFRVLDSNARVSRVQSETRSFHRMRWSVRLVPRRSGSIRIPPLRFGDNRSEPIVLEVEPVPASLQAAQDVFVELEVTPRNPYPGQQTRIVTRLYHNQPLREMSLGEPSAGQALIFRGAPDTRIRVTRNGQNYNVVERTILSTPGQAGELQLGPAVFRGSIADTGGDDAHGLADGIRHIYRESNPVTLQVREPPAAIDTNRWLPASQLEIRLEREGGDRLETGDSLAVTLELRGIGVAADNLPENLLLDVTGPFKIYADQAQRRTRVEGPPGAENLHAVLRQGYAIVPERPGDITLPALELHWWDTGQDRARVARLEAQTFRVAGPETSAGQAGAETFVTGAAYPSESPRRAGLSWPWLLAVLCGLSIAATAWLARRPCADLLARYARLRRVRNCRLRVERACREMDPQAARQGLIDWGRVYWNDERIHGLRQIAALAGSQSWADEMARLDAAVFAGAQSEWRGRALPALLRRLRGSSVVQSGRSDLLLPEPYPGPGSGVRAGI